VLATRPVPRRAAGPSRREFPMTALQGADAATMKLAHTEPKKRAPRSFPPAEFVQPTRARRQFSVPSREASVRASGRCRRAQARRVYAAVERMRRAGSPSGSAQDAAAEVPRRPGAARERPPVRPPAIRRPAVPLTGPGSPSRLPGLARVLAGTPATGTGVSIPEAA